MYFAISSDFESSLTLQEIFYLNQSNGGNIWTLYIFGDIPKEYHYARFGSNYIELYNTDVLQGQKNFYRIYNYDNYFAYDTGTTNYSYNTYYAQDIPVSDSIWYRRDMPLILVETFILIIFFIFVFNIVTSVFKKGGVFGGLL